MVKTINAVEVYTKMITEGVKMVMKSLVKTGKATGHLLSPSHSEPCPTLALARSTSEVVMAVVRKGKDHS